MNRFFFLKIKHYVFNEHAILKWKFIIIIHYNKQKAKAMQYRIFKDFHDKTFKFELNNELLKINMTMLS